MGEHAAVYGRTALVAAAGLRLTAALSARPGPDPGTVRLRIAGRSVPALDETVSWAEIRATTHRIRAAWERYAEAPTADAFRAVQRRAGGGDRASLHLRLALGEAADAVDRIRGDREPPPPIELAVVSEIPVGSGFGSSAAAAVAVILAYFAHRGIEPRPDRLHWTALEVERRQHGTPSGVDDSTVIRGGVLTARRRAAGDVELETTAVRRGRLERFRIVGTGPPAEDTGTVVAAVGELRERRRERIDPVFDRLGELAVALRDELRRGRDDERERPGEVTAVLREAEALLEELGVVPAPARRVVRAVEELGGAAKVSGAGSLEGPAAGNLLVYHPDDAVLERLDEELRRRLPGTTLRALPGLRSFPVALGVPGARLEEPS